MDEVGFWRSVRVVGILSGALLSVFIVLYLIIVAGYATHAYINRIDPDPPTCVHDQTCQDSYGSLVKCTRTYSADDAGRPINLPDAPMPRDAGAK